MTATKIDNITRIVAARVEELETIAERTRNMATVGNANPQNSEFVRLMDRHLELTREVQRLLESIWAVPGPE